MVIHYAPGVYVERPRPRDVLVGVRMDIAGFVGIAEKGPVDKAVALDGWPAFLDTFGNFLPNAYLAYAVRAFFENGGRRCHVVRVAADEVRTGLDLALAQPADRSSSFVLSAAGIVKGSLVIVDQSVATTTAGAQPADRRSSIVTDTGGFAAGRLVAVTQPGRKIGFAMPVLVDSVAKEIRWREPLDAALNLTLAVTLSTSHRCRRLVQSVAGNELVWRSPLDAAFDPTKAMTFAAGAGTADGTIYDEDGNPLLSLKASSPGQWGDALAVSVRHTRSAETSSRPRPAADLPGLLSVGRIVGFAKDAIVEVLQDGAPIIRRRIELVDIRERRLVWDADLPTPAFDLAAAANGTKPIRVRRHAMALSVRLKGRLAETFSDLDLPTLADPDLSPVNERSKLIRIGRIAGPAYALPDPLLPLLRNGVCSLSGGRDGIAMLKPERIVGDASAQERRGVRVFEAVDEPAALAVPDAMIEPMPAVAFAPLPKEEPDPCSLCPALPPVAELPPPPVVEATPDFSPDDIFFMQSGLVTHCEARGDRVALLDVPRWRDRPDAYDLDALTAWRQRFDSSYAALYFPWIELTDPLTLPSGKPRAVPPSGHAAGCFAWTDFARGTQAAPANLALQWAAALPRSIDAAEQEGLNPAGINCIRTFSGRGIRIYGARALSSDPQWRFLNVRRLVIRLKRSLYRGLQWAVLEPNNQIFVDAVFAQVEGFLETEWDERRLAGRTADEAFYVRQIVTEGSYDHGEFILEIGVAPVIPAEFVVLRLSRTEDRLGIAEDTAAGGAA
ncbi:putative Phage tail sheath protein [Mesorhizobium prunaredense]|uniref:Putative Phage tail sheath protein n=1 Tax=Mesorhizobium prunaredense TaxID=1631249 RepID=A0A1R3VFK8_9HYPH|nr:phage tail sheath subtilisin-like domain-containing protein [Mesorhizobium prunaredense]SIT58615.1 putative Phage tail sheath protein [Mesorhizobium prunaredense]